MTDAAKLEPCPFGCKAHPYPSNWISTRRPRVHCPTCHTEGPAADSIELAIAAWNRRAGLEAGWEKMPAEKPGQFPFTGARLILGWDDSPSLPAHTEMGRWRSGVGPGSGWCNTYGHPFSATPTHFMRLPVLKAEGPVEVGKQVRSEAQPSEPHTP